MSAYAIMRFEKCKKGSITARERHNERRKESYASNKDIDPERSNLNIHLVQPPPSYLKACLKRIEDAGCQRIRKDSTYMVEVLYTASPEFFEGKDTEQITEYFRRCCGHARTTFGNNNILSAVVHMDEKTPHMHLCFVPITPDGRLSAKDILGNQKSLSQHQDRFYNLITLGFPELKRGQSAIETHRKHVPTWLIKQAPEMQKLFDKIETTLEGLTFYNTSSQKEKLRRQLKKMLPKLKTYVAEVEKLQETIQDNNRTISQLKQTIGDEQSRNRSLQSKLMDAEQAVSLVQADRDRCYDLLKRIPPDIVEEARQSKIRERMNQKKHEGVL